MYLNINDLQKGVRAEVLTSLTRDNTDVVEQGIAEAEQEVAGYLSARYEITKELLKTPLSTDRLPMVVKLVRDIALYNIYNFSAPVNIPENRVKCYENAIALLKAAQAEKVSVTGLVRLTTADGSVNSSYIAFGGNEKRQNHI
ncbi:MAG: phage protein Gp36 family protein [Bacteroidales bacterium]